MRWPMIFSAIDVFAKKYKKNQGLAQDAKNVMKCPPESAIKIGLWILYIYTVYYII